MLSKFFHHAKKIILGRSAVTWNQSQYIRKAKLKGHACIYLVGLPPSPKTKGQHVA